MAHFSEPAIHNVSDVTALAQDYNGGVSGSFTTLRLTFTDEHGCELGLSAYFQPRDAHRAHELAAAINNTAVRALQAAE